MSLHSFCRRGTTFKHFKNKWSPPHLTHVSLVSQWFFTEEIVLQSAAKWGGKFRRRFPGSQSLPNLMHFWVANEKWPNISAENLGWQKRPDVLILLNPRHLCFSAPFSCFSVAYLFFLWEGRKSTLTGGFCRFPLHSSLCLDSIADVWEGIAEGTHNYSQNEPHSSGRVWNLN